jgi:hypothetical protein
MFVCVRVYACDSIAQTLFKNIYVKPFINNTEQFGLEAKFTNEVIEEIIADGRLSFINTESDADVILIVTIKQYTLTPFTYDVNMLPEQYKLKVIVSVSLVDNYNNIYLLTKANVKGIHIYRDIMKNQYDDDLYAHDLMTEEDAREILWQKMSRNIVGLVVKGISMLEKKH